MPSGLASVTGEFLETPLSLGPHRTCVELRNTRGKFAGMAGDLRVFFRGKHSDRTTRRWIADGVFQGLISCCVEADTKPGETAQMAARNIASCSPIPPVKANRSTPSRGAV